ncbi:hypothetical protein [Alteromonas sp. ASW11-130]|uniref:hypothetical protein n=1 Tax=Alteromonas sp. ASW11-130 TaxID=3015775 RepID=UPI0022420E48|nr:hypothetical protein [Alteromonas sp. ASW11-130]MCW8092763.1 hypothetical protein [Alteromonas sp. ASW11-130]
MNKVTPAKSDEKVYFFDKPENVRLILRIFYFLCVVLFLLDFFVHRHIYVYFESIPTFYALYGFVACVVLVLIAKLMRKVLMRDENYFSDASQPDSTAPLNSESEH